MTHSKALFAQLSAVNGVHLSCAVGDQINFLTSLPCAVITQVRSHLRHNFAMALSIRYAILNIHKYIHVNKAGLIAFYSSRNFPHTP